MKLFDTFDESGYHSSFSTTFELDFEAYETVVLSRLRKANCNNNLLLADARMLTMATEKLPRFAGRRYGVFGLRAPGVFHPKLTLQLGRDKGRLLVSSANMTAAGLAGNLEVMGQVELTSHDGQEASVLRAAFDYLWGLLPAEAMNARDQLQWALNRTPWLQLANASSNITDGENRIHAEFLTPNSVQGIGARFLELVGDAPVRRLVVASPYWDDDLAALNWLHSALSPLEVALLIQPSTGLFPSHRLQPGIPVRYFQILAAVSGKSSRFAHGKIVIAQTDEADHVLFGSPNCTTPALGSTTFAGRNQEAALYRRLAQGQALAVLDLNKRLEPNQSIDAASITPFAKGESIELDACERRGSGTFELREDILTWHRPVALVGQPATLELLDRRGIVLPATLTLRDDIAGRTVYRVTIPESPAFARAVALAEVFSLAIVTSTDEIHRYQLPTKGSKVSNALDRLDDPDGLEGLETLQILQELISAAQSVASQQDSPADRLAGGQTEDKAVPEEQRVLSYAEFAQARNADAIKRNFAKSGMSGTLPNSVRQMLNRVLGVGSLRHTADEPDDDERRRAALNTGGETNNPEAYLEEGEEDADWPVEPKLDKKAQVIRRRQNSVVQNQSSLAKAVVNFLEERRKNAVVLTVVDLLRLRVLLQVVLATGSSAEDLLGEQAKGTRRAVALLPCRGENSWTHLASRLLFEFFRNSPGSNDALVRRLHLEASPGTGLPIDVAECLFLCQWAVQALRSAHDDKGRAVVPPSGIQQLCLDVELSCDELLGWMDDSDLRQRVWLGMENRYSQHLGIDREVLRSFYGQTIQATTALPLDSAKHQAMPA